MNKRQRKKYLKKQFDKIPEEYKYCGDCGERLSPYNSYHMRHGTCDSTCHLHLVGMSWGDFM